MPNYVRNELTIMGLKEDIQKCLDYCKSEDRTFDFNKIVPMPAELDIADSSINNSAILCYLLTLNHEEDIFKARNVLKTVPDLFYGTLDEAVMNANFPKFENLNEQKEYVELGEKLVDNCSKYGCTTWYDWCCNNWGTKWNALESSIDLNENDCLVCFDTAWSAPVPIISTLSEKFPDLIFNLKYADEDIGFNCGYTNFINGSEENSKIFDSREYENNPELENEAIEFACDIWGYDPKEYLENEEEFEEE